MHTMLLSVAQTAAELPEGGILNLDKSLIITMIAQIINVALLTVILVFILYKPVKKFLNNRTQRIKQELDNAGALNEEARELKEKYEKLIDNIEEEREELLRQSQKKAVEKSDQLLFDAQKEADKLQKRVMDDLEIERRNMQDEMMRQIIEVSYVMANRFVEVSIDEETQNRFIEQALADWDGGSVDA